jgi:sec-independent protein translocase protein TatA
MEDVHTSVLPMVADLGTQELILILLVCVLLFGAKKLPELARGSGRALRIFKAEVQGGHPDHLDGAADGAPDNAKTSVDERLAALDAQQAELDAERRRLLDS